MVIKIDIGECCNKNEKKEKIKIKKSKYKSTACLNSEKSAENIKIRSYKFYLENKKKNYEHDCILRFY